MTRKKKTERSFYVSRKARLTRSGRRLHSSVAATGPAYYDVVAAWRSGIDPTEALTALGRTISNFSFVYLLIELVTTAHAFVIRALGPDVAMNAKGYHVNFDSHIQHDRTGAGGEFSRLVALAGTEAFWKEMTAITDVAMHPVFGTAYLPHFADLLQVGMDFVCAGVNGSLQVAVCDGSDGHTHDSPPTFTVEGNAEGLGGMAAGGYL